jgi:hypothetical protein
VELEVVVVLEEELVGELGVVVGEMLKLQQQQNSMPSWMLILQPTNLKQKIFN